MKRTGSAPGAKYSIVNHLVSSFEKLIQKSTLDFSKVLCKELMNIFISIQT